MRGPSSRLRQIELVRTQPVDMEGRLQSFKIRRTVLPPAVAGAARLEPDRVLVDVAIAELTATRELADIPVRWLLAPGAPAIRGTKPEKVTVTLQGRPEALRLLEPAAVAVYVDCVGLAPGGAYELAAQAQTPPGLRAVAVTPETIRVEMAE